MKRGWSLGRGLVLCLLLLCLPSCALMLERGYTEAVDHAEGQLPLGNATYQVETYPALRAALLSYVEEGLEEGFLRCPTTYPGNLSVDLEKAKRQLMEEEPLGSYALDDISFRTTRIIAYYEVELDFTYKVDPREVAGLPRISSREGLVRALGQGVEELDSRLCVYLTAYPEEDAQFFESALRDAYGHRPAALGRPQLSVELYPQTGSRRVAVLELDYGEDLDQLEGRRERLEEALDEFGQDQDAQGLFESLRERCELDPEAGSTAYDALVEGRANAEGITLGYAALCRRGEMECRVVWDAERCYAELRSPEGERLGYLDVTGDQFVLLEALPSAAEETAA